MIKLGSNAKDIITGFKGIVTSRTSHITGCDRYGITPKIDKSGIAQESMAFDESTIEIIDKGISDDFKDGEKTKKTTTKKVGGPAVYKTKNAY